MSYTVLDPTAEQAPPEIRPAPRPATLAGLTVGFISNGREGTKGFFGHLDTALPAALGPTWFSRFGTWPVLVLLAGLALALLRRAPR